MAHWGGFTFKWYKSLLHNESIMSALYYTLLVAILSSVIATIIGTISAIGINKMKTKPRKLLLNINYLPVLNPDIVTAVALMSLFAFVNIEFGFTTMLLSHIMFSIPYVILSVLPKVRTLPQNIEEAAMDLGATPMYALRKVILPQIKPGIISGFLMAFTMSIDDFIISFFNTGNGVSNLSIEIYGMARRGNDENGSIVLRLVELQEGIIDYSKPNRILLTEKEKEKYLLQENDFLFARVNGNPLNVGRCAVFHSIGEAVYHNDHIIRVHFDDSMVNGVFASTILNSEYGKDEMRNKIKTSAGQYTISQDGIGAIKTIVPPIDLQNQFADFVAQVDKHKSVVQKSLDETQLLFDSLMQKYFG